MYLCAAENVRQLELLLVYNGPEFPSTELVTSKGNKFGNNLLLECPGARPHGTTYYLQPLPHTLQSNTQANSVRIELPFNAAGALPVFSSCGIMAISVLGHKNQS